MFRLTAIKVASGDLCLSRNGLGEVSGDIRLLTWSRRIKSDLCNSRGAARKKPDAFDPRPEGAAIDIQSTGWAPQIAIHSGQSILLSEPNGQVNSPSERGLFRDTRVISAWAI